MLCHFACILSSADFFFKELLSGLPSVSNSLEPDQARHIVGPDLVPNCLQVLLADNKLKLLLAGKELNLNSVYNILQIKPVLNSH